MSGYDGQLPLSNEDLDLSDKNAVIDAALKERDWFADRLNIAERLLEKVVSDTDIGVVPRSHIDNIEKFLAK